MRPVQLTHTWVNCPAFLGFVLCCLLSHLVSEPEEVLSELYITWWFQVSKQHLEACNKILREGCWVMIKCVIQVAKLSTLLNKGLCILRNDNDLLYTQKFLQHDSYK